MYHFISRLGMIRTTYHLVCLCLGTFPDPEELLPLHRAS